MERFIPYSKLSKKAKRAADNARRRSWGTLNPITRKHDDPRAYKRQKAQRQNPAMDSDAGLFLCYGAGLAASFLYSAGDSCSIFMKRL